MRLRSKLFLALAILFLGIEFTPFGSVLHGIPLPLAAISFGLFLITWGLPLGDFDDFKKDQALREQLIRDERKKRRAARSRARPARDRIDAVEKEWDRSPKQTCRSPQRHSQAVSSPHR